MSRCAAGQIVLLAPCVPIRLKRRRLQTSGPRAASAGSACTAVLDAYRHEDDLPFDGVDLEVLGRTDGRRHSPHMTALRDYVYLALLVARECHRNADVDKAKEWAGGCNDAGLEWIRTGVLVCSRYRGSFAGSGGSLACRRCGGGLHTSGRSKAESPAGQAPMKVRASSTIQTYLLTASPASDGGQFLVSLRGRLSCRLTR